MKSRNKPVDREMPKAEMPDETLREEEIQSGLTWRSSLALIYASVVFTPASIWFFLATYNPIIGGSVMWTTVILFAEIARLTGRPLTKQEAVVIAYGVGVVGAVAIGGPSVYGASPLSMVYRSYFIESPGTTAFGIGKLVPEWYSPPLELHVGQMATFFHPAWLMPFAISVSFAAIYLLVDISLGYIAKIMYVDIEKLPFPLDIINCEAVIALTSRPKNKMRIITVCAVFSLLFSFFEYTIPFMAKTLGYSFQWIPVPWADFSGLLHGMNLKGVSFGISTDLILATLGLILPFGVILSMFAGSFAIYVVGNSLLVNLSLTRFAQEWRVGMDIGTSLQRSLLYVWTAPLVGMAIAAGVVPLVLHPEIVTGIFESIRKSRSPAAKLILPFLILFVSGGLAATIINYLLIPELNLLPYYIILTLIWPFVYTVIVTRSRAITGFQMDIPNFNQLVYFASGYPNVNLWFAPIYTAGGSPGWAGTFFAMDYCRGKPLDYVKIFLAVLPMAFLMAFFTTYDFWRLAPIPSAAYPGVEIYWPTSSVIQNLWINHSPELFQPLWILYGFIPIALAEIANSLFLHLPFSTMGFVLGASQAISNSTLILLAGVIGRILEMRIGKKWYTEQKTAMAVGLCIGEGLAVVTGSIIALLIRSVWYLPY